MIRTWLRRLFGKRQTAPPRKRRRTVRAACSIEGCNRTAIARGWCGNHWQRWRKWGDPLGSAPPRPERYTPEEDALLLALPVNPKTGWVLRGYLDDAAERMGRSTAGAGHRRAKLLRMHREAS